MAEAPISTQDVSPSLEEALALLDQPTPAPGTMVRPDTVRPVKAPGSGNGVLDLVAGDFAQQIGQIFGAHRSLYLAAPDRRRHLWHCCLAAPNASSWTRPEADFAALRLRLLRGRGKDLIAQAHGACPPGLERALGKLGATARPLSVYAALVAVLLRDDAGAKLLRHAPKLPDATIMAVAELPPRLCTKALVTALCDFDDVEEGLPFVTWTIERLEALLAVDLTDAVRRSKHPLALLRTMQAKLPFPPPPWPGDALLVPLTSRDALRAAGKRLRNCLREDEPLSDAAREVVRRKVYHYEWRGSEPALLCFRHVEPLGWVLEEAKGAANARLSQQTRAEIAGRLVGMDDVCPRVQDGHGVRVWNVCVC